MPDSSSNVEILLNIRAQGQSELAAAQAEISGLKAAATEASVSTANWSQRMRQASIDAAAWNASTNNVGQAVRRTAADFAPATAAQREFSLRAEEAAINAAALERGVIQMSSGITRAIPGTGALGSEIRGLGMGSVATAGQVGLLNTVLIGTGIVGALAFAAALAAIVTKGVEVQKTLQDVGSGVQGTLKSNTDFSQSQIREAGPESMIAISEAAKDAQVPITDLAKAFDQVFPSAARANTSIKGLSDVLAQLISQEDALHIPQAKIATDLEQMFNGSVRNTNQLAQELGVTKEQAEAWRQAGTTTDELTAKQQAFAVANDTGSDSIARAEQKVSAAFQQLAEAATKPLIEPLTKALQDCASAMNDPGFQAGAAMIVGAIEQIMAGAQKAISILQGFDDAIYGSIKAMGAWIVEHGKVGQAQEFVDDQGPGLYRPGSSGLSDWRPSQAPGVTGLQAGSGGGFGDIELPEVVVNASTGTREPVGGVKGGGGGGGGKGPSQDTTDQKEISELQTEINAKTEEYHSLIEQNDVAHKLGLTTLQQQDTANLKAGNDFIASIDANISKLQQMKQAVMDVAAAHGGEDLAEKKQEAELDKIIAKLQILKGQTEISDEKDTFWGQWDLGIRNFGDSLVLTGQKAEQTFQSIVNTGISSTANALTGLITGTKNWAQAFEQAGQSILKTLIQVELQNLAGIALQNTAQATQRLGDARTAAAGVYASAASIPYVGWIIAPVAAAAAFAAVLAFAEGGIVEGSPSSTDNRIARVATGEGIVTSRAVAHYGPSMIHQMNALTFADGGVVGSFGGAGGGGTASRPVSVNNFLDKGDMVQHIISHPDMEHFVVNMIRKNRFQIKV